MRSAVVFTLFDRPNYLWQTLTAWDGVRGLRDWHLVFSIEPSLLTVLTKKMIDNFVLRNGIVDYEVHTNDEVLGVLMHPWIAVTKAFMKADFVVRAEDDLLPSTDFLEFMAYCRDTFQNSPDILTVCAATPENGALDAVHVEQRFSPWLWGTWWDRWRDVLAPTWDTDYSTYNGTPGHQSGWDWNINTRLMPQRNLLSAFPNVSRVQNIGVVGVHGTAENFQPFEHWQWGVDPQNYCQSA